MRWASPTRIIPFLLFFAVLGSCHRRDEVRTEETRPKTQSLSRNVATVQPDPQAALRAADDIVERARLLARPVEPLSSEAIQGMALPLYAELPGLTYERMLQRISEVGATHVSIVVSWRQRTIFANRLQPHPDETLPDERLLELAAAAHEAGLKTMLFPIIHVERRNEGEWRGRLAPGSFEKWKEDYRAFVFHYAELAERADIDILSVGSELSSLEERTGFWKTIISDTRKRYSGELIYSANWDHYDHPDFWGELDYIGVSSYFEVARHNHDPVFVMARRWETFRDDMLDFARETKKPLILTEVGYPSIDSSAVKPWDYTARTDPNPNAQLAAFRALADAWGAVDDEAKPRFAGLFIWHGWGPGGDDDISYSIWEKSAHDFVRRWYDQ